MKRRYLGPTRWYWNCPIQGSCIWKGIRCRPDLRCTWLEFELKAHREVREKSHDGRNKA